MWNSKILLATVFSAIVATPNAIAENCQYITLSGHPNLPPVVWGDYLSTLGSAPDLINEVLIQHNIEVFSDFKGGNNRVIRDFQLGKFEINPAMARTPEAEEYTLFIEPAIYTQSYDVIVKKRSKLNITRWGELKKLKGVTSKDTYLGEEFESYADKYLDLVRIRNTQQGLKMLNVGRVDYAIYPQIQDDLFVSLFDLEGVFEKMPVDIASFKLYVGISKATTCTLPIEAISEWIQTSLDNGHSEHVLNDNLYKWMGFGLNTKK